MPHKWQCVCVCLVDSLQLYTKIVVLDFRIELYISGIETKFEAQFTNY